METSQSTYAWYADMDAKLWQLEQATAWREKLEVELTELNIRIAAIEG